LYHRRRPATEKKAEDELPSEYLASSLSKQPQGPPQRSEQEIQEEEELQLALALSQSEHEAKDKEVDELFHSLLELSNYHVNAFKELILIKKSTPLKKLKYTHKVYELNHKFQYSMKLR